MNTLAPIVLFVYKRPVHTLNLLQSLQKCRLSDQSTLIVYADGPPDNASKEELEKIAAVRNYVKREQWCNEVRLIERSQNMGLADSIISGVTEIINQFGRIIVLEDDLFLGIGFLEYMNKTLELFEKDERVMHISGFMYPVRTKLPEMFFVNTTSCWGWATWQRAWKHYNPSAIDLVRNLNLSNRLSEYSFNGAAPFYNHLLANLNGKLKTWAIKWNTSVFLQHGLCLHPSPSLVRNTGNDNSGTNGSEPVFNKQSITNFIDVKNIPLEESAMARKAIEKFYQRLGKRKNIAHRILRRIFSLAD